MKDWGKFLVVTLAGIMLAALVSYAINEDAAAAEASEIETEAVTVNEVVIPSQNAVAPAESQEIEVLEREEPWCPAMEDIEAERPIQTPLPPEIIEPAEEDEEPGEIIDAEPEDEPEPEGEPEDEVVFEEDEDYESFVDADGNVWYIGKFLDEDNQDYDEPEDEDEDEWVEDEESEDEDEEPEPEDDFDWSNLPVIDAAPIEDFDPYVNYLFSE